MLKALAQNRHRMAVLIAALAIPFAVGVGFENSFSCFYRSESASVGIGPTGTSVPVVESSCSSLFDLHPLGTLIFASVPVFLVLVGVVGTLLRWRAVPGIVGGFIIAAGWGLSVLAFALFPLYYAPAGIALCVSSAIESSS